jgi:hypothetical protein
MRLQCYGTRVGDTDLGSLSQFLARVALAGSVAVISIAALPARHTVIKFRVLIGLCLLKLIMASNLVGYRLTIGSGTYDSMEGT